MPDDLKSVDSGKVKRKAGEPNPTIAGDLRRMVTGWYRGKDQASGSGGDDRSRAIDSAVDEMVKGKKP